MKIITVISTSTIRRYGYSDGVMAYEKALEFAQRPGVWKVIVDDLSNLAKFEKNGYVGARV